MRAISIFGLVAGGSPIFFTLSMFEYKFCLPWQSPLSGFFLPREIIWLYWLDEDPLVRRPSEVFHFVPQTCAQFSQMLFHGQNPLSGHPGRRRCALYRAPHFFFFADKGSPDQFETMNATADFCTAVSFQKRRPLKPNDIFAPLFPPPSHPGLHGKVVKVQEGKEVAP